VQFLGSGYERKGLPALLAAFARLPEDKSELWVVGYDKQQAAMQRQAARLGIAARVRFFGAQKDVRPFYGAADLFALPTLYDPFPNAALEALACGLPVVTTTSCGAAELITAANGAVVAANDVAALASAISALCLPGRAAAMRDAARSSVSGLDLASMAQRLTALYAQSLGRKPPHTGAAQG
jgi:UDP-glucose:(heptosyl)LPS alpha-1,3-glucosyltransferase